MSDKAAWAASDAPQDPGSARVRRWTERLNGSRRALWLLFVASAAETIIVPIPIELVLIPYMVMNRDRLWRIAAAVTAGCLCAALLGYGIGYLFLDSIGSRLVEAWGWAGPLEQFRDEFRQHGFWAVLAVGITPIPFQVAMLAAGAAGYSIALFVLAAGIARGFRYFGLALLVHLFGARAEQLWRRHKVAAALVATTLILAIVAATVWL